MSLWLNGQQVAVMEHSEGYEAANRDIPYENLFVIGYKSACCMEGPGQEEPMMTSGAYDQLRISKVARYVEKDRPSELVPQDTVTFDTAFVGQTDTLIVIDSLYPLPIVDTTSRQ